MEPYPGFRCGWSKDIAVDSEWPSPENLGGKTLTGSRPVLCTPFAVLSSSHSLHLLLINLAHVQESLQVMLIPETFLTEEAQARSRNANVGLEVGGQGISAGGGRETSTSRSQQVC